MLSFLKEWVEGIAIAVIMASIFEMILPNGSTKKYIKVILGIYVVFSIISPFVDSNSLYSLDISDTIEEYTANISNSTSTQSSVGNNLNELYISTFEEEIKSAVESQGYSVSTCTVDAVFDSEDEEAGINAIYIKLMAKNDENSNSIESIEEVNISVGDAKNNDDETENDISSKDIQELKEYLSDYFEVDEDIINIEN